MLLCSLVLACLAGCSGGGGATPATGSADTAPAADSAAGGTPGQARPVQLFPVKMRPQEAVEPGFRTTCLARPSLLSLDLPAVRTVSDAGEVITVPAGDSAAGLGGHNVEAKGSYMVFNSRHEDWEYDSLADAAYCGYSIDLAGYTGIPTLSIVWDEQAYPVLQDEYWVALANYDKDRWDFFEGPLDQVITLESLGPYTSPEGRLAVVPVVLASARILLLHELKIGAAEVRATGLQEGEVNFRSIEAEYYVGELASSADLSGDCAPVGDQLTWGSCTAFALAQGCYNHELGLLYGGFGWDLGLPEFQTSPKYLYVESGKDAGHMPSPDFGRVMGTVAADLQTRGVATELNAPYDMDYNYDWTEDALADAAVLKTEAAIGIPLTDNGSIDTIRMILGRWRKTVYFKTYIDYEFYYYDEDEVWAYTGPPLAGHALLIVGYDDARKAFKVRNSWGHNWGDDGYCWVSYESLLNAGARTEAGYLVEDYSPAVALRFLDSELDCPPPVNLRATQGTTMNVIHLEWDCVGEADGFVIYRDNRTSPVAVTDGCEWSDPTLTDGLAHSYWVKATYGGSPSPWSQPVTGFAKATMADLVRVAPTTCGKGQLITFEPLVDGYGPLTYAWDFGGGATPNTSTEDTPTVLIGAAGSYAASLTITDEFGSNGWEFTLTVVDGLDPVAGLALDTEVCRPNQEVAFDASGSSDPDGRIILYEWDWEGDGTFDATTLGPITSHTYTEFPADLEPQVRVTDGSGLTATAGCSLTVLDHNNPPVVSFTVDCPDDIWQPPCILQFDATETFDYEDDITMYHWDLDGDGFFETHGADMVSFQHQYDDHATFDAALRVVDAQGLYSETSEPIRIGLGQEVPGWEVHGVATLPGTAEINLDMTTDRDGLPRVMAVDSNSHLHYMETSTDPEYHSDWIHEEVDSNGPVNGEASLAILFSGRAAISFYSNEPDPGLYLVWRNMPDDWWSVPVWVPEEDTELVGVVNDMELIGNLLAIACNLESTGGEFADGLYYVRCTSMAASSPYNWTASHITAETHLTAPLRLGVVNGLPAIAYNVGDGDASQLYYAWADTTYPGDESSWTVHGVDAGNEANPLAGLTELGGQPVVCCARAGEPPALRLLRGKASHPAAASDWFYMAAEPAAARLTGADITRVMGLPWAAWTTDTDPPALYMTHALNITPNDDNDWNTTEVCTGEYYGLRITTVNGLPALVFFCPADDWVYYLTPDY